MPLIGFFSFSISDALALTLHGRYVAKGMQLAFPAICNKLLVSNGSIICSNVLNILRFQRHKLLF